MTKFAPALALSLSLVVSTSLRAQEGGEPPSDEAELPRSEERTVPEREQMRYFLIGGPEDVPVGRKKPRSEPKKGWRLLLILPGGSGDAAFNPFCRRIARHAVDLDEYLVVQLVAPVWTDEQAKSLVWPHEGLTVDEAKFTTEEFLDAVIEDVESEHALDRDYIFTFCWSSSGPACYRYSLSDACRATGFYQAMAAFKPEQLGSLGKAKGKPYFVLHSPDERVVPFRMAEDAVERLGKKKAKVKLLTYEGGHGWRGDLWGNMRTGIEWLEKNHAKAKKAPKPKRKKAGAKKTGARKTGTEQAGGKKVDEGDK